MHLAGQVAEPTVANWHMEPPYPGSHMQDGGGGGGGGAARDILLVLPLLAPSLLLLTTTAAAATSGSDATHRPWPEQPFWQPRGTLSRAAA